VTDFLKISRPLRVLLWTVLAAGWGGAVSDGALEKRVEDRQGGVFVIGTRVAYFDSGGQAVWDDAGISLADTGRPQIQDARFSRRRELVVVWKEALSAGDEWRAQALDSSGQRLWSESGVLLREAAADSVQTQLAIGDDGRITLFWEESCARGPCVHVKRWSPRGFLEEEKTRAGTLNDFKYNAATK
jgi:hypothetical protein